MCCVQLANGVRCDLYSIVFSPLPVDLQPVQLVDIPRRTPSVDPMHAAPALSEYDRFVVFFSGGKDSQACVLHLLDEGVPADRIELHHHLVDGKEGSALMDWPVTDAYCAAFAKAFGLRLFFSWKVGGFEREMLRNEELTAPIAWQSEGGEVRLSGGERGKQGTRLMFPQVSADLSQRWCSSYLKVDVGARVLTSEARFLHGKTLVVTGERAEESSARARYKTFEPNRTDNRNGARVKRHIDHWRPIHSWTEAQVWACLERHRVRAHPAYFLGWGRTSCRACIFGSANQWATIAKHMPESFEQIALYEERFGKTIQRKLSLRALAQRGTSFEVDDATLALANGTVYDIPIIVGNSEPWPLPKGAFGESAGPT